MEKELPATQSREKINDMLDASKEDYEKYKNTGLEAYLRDAAEKLYTIAQNIIELKTKKRVGGKTSFDKRYRDTDLGISETARIGLARSLDALHIYGRHGTEEKVYNEEKISETYPSVFNQLEELFRRL